MIDTWNVRQFTNKAQILRFLESDRLYAAYAIGDLEPGLFDQSMWLGAERGGNLEALTMHFCGVKPPVLFLMGNIEGLKVIFANALCPESGYINCRFEHLPLAKKIFQWDEIIPMWRMARKANQAKPVSGNCLRLTSDHAYLLINLYNHEGVPGLSDGQLEYGIFYGVFVDDQLVAAAGTHLVSFTYNLAAVGNVFTHPNYRGQGYGTTTTGAVLAELEEQGIRDVVLNVRQSNGAAIHIYEKLGFKRYCEFFAGNVFHRD